MGNFWRLVFLTQSVVETGAVETALYYVNEQLNSIFLLSNVFASRAAVVRRNSR